jgi:hypothetical protein
MRTKRLLGGVVLALALAIMPTVTTAASPICALYTPDNVEWYLFLCYLDGR